MEKQKQKLKPKIRLQDLMDFQRAILVAIASKSINLKISYALTKNKSITQRELKRLEDAKNSNERFKEFQAKRIALAKKYAKKDSNGKPMYIPKIVPSEFDIENIGAFEDELKPIRDQYKDVLIEELLNEEIELEHPIYTISIKEFPMDFNINDLRPMIKESDEDIEHYLFEENKA